MKKFITLMLIALVATFGFVSCTYNITPAVEDTSATEPTAADTAWNEYKTGISWAEFAVNVGTLVSGGTVKGMTIDPTTVPLEPVIDDKIGSLAFTVVFDKYNYATDYAVTGTVAVKYTGEYVKDTSTINAENMDVDFDVTFEKIARNTMNTPDLKVKFSTLNGTPGNIVLLDGSDVTTVTLKIVNGTVKELTGASLTSLTFPNTKVEY